MCNQCKSSYTRIKKTIVYLKQIISLNTTKYTIFHDRFTKLYTGPKSIATHLPHRSQPRHRQVSHFTKKKKKPSRRDDHSQKASRESTSKAKNPSLLSPD